MTKLTYGCFIEDSAVLINKGKDNSRIAIAEGPETALSIKEADPDLTIYAVLGSSNFMKVPLGDEVKEIIICADNDYPREEAGQNSKKLGKEIPASEKKVLEAAKFFAEKGIDVYRVMPVNPKEDFNDVLRNEGVEKVREYLSNPEKLTHGETVERLGAKVQAHFEASGVKEKETLRFEEEEVILTKRLQSLIQDYRDAEAIYRKAARQFLENIGDPNQKEFKKAMNDTCEALKVKTDKLLKEPDYQELIKHEQFALSIGEDRVKQAEALKTGLSQGRLTPNEIYRLNHGVQSNAETTGLVQSRGRGQGRSV